MAALQICYESMRAAWTVLLRQWQASSSLWGDAVQHRFQKSYMEDYEPAVVAALRELAQLDQVIAQAKRHVK